MRFRHRGSLATIGNCWRWPFGSKGSKKHKPILKYNHSQKHPIEISKARGTLFHPRLFGHNFLDQTNPLGVPVSCLRREGAPHSPRPARHRWLHAALCPQGTPRVSPVFKPREWQSTTMVAAPVFLAKTLILDKVASTPKQGSPLVDHSWG